MSFPTSIEAWLRKEGFVCEKAEERKAGSAVLVVARRRNDEWSKAVIQKNGLLILRPTSANDPSMTGLLLPGLTVSTPEFAAQALDHLMTTPAYEKLLDGIMTYQGGCCVDGLGTACATFSPAG